MHRKRQVAIKKQGIGTERGGIFFLPSANPSENQQQEVQTQPKPNHQIQIPPLLLPYQPRHELPISSNPSATARKPVRSKPQKRTTVMASILTTPSSLPFSRTESFLRDRPNFEAYPKVNYALSPAIKTLACRLFVHISRTHLLCARLRAVVFVSFPSFYFFVANPHRLLVVNLLCILAFFITILVCLNLLLPRLSYIRLLLARSLPPKFKPARLPTKAPKPVVWSIGSKLQTEKKLHSGSCVQVYSNNDVYEGEFHKGKCSGSGVYHYYKRGRYEGDWIDGKYDGYGVETRARGSRYRGQYKQGLKHGIGVCRFYTGDVYAGEWYNGHCHGCGIHTCEDGSKYVGEFKWGVKHGLGHYHFRNGDTYAGEYFSDKMHGFGVYLFGNGHRYEGAWHEGRRQGFGVYTFSNGETQSGHWQNGVLSRENSSQGSPFAATSHPKFVPSAETSCPGSPYAASESKVLNAAQEAQRAAGRAYNVAQIDERVNKTIVIANRAANAARVAAVKAVQKRMHDSQINDLPNSLFYL